MHVCAVQLVVHCSALVEMLTSETGGINIHVQITCGAAAAVTRCNDI